MRLICSQTTGERPAAAKNLDKFVVGSTIQIMIREKLYNAEIIKKPFVEKRNKETK